MTREKQQCEGECPKGPRERVSHNYHDYATGERNSMAHEHLEHAIGPGGDPPFPVKLHYALTELQSDDLDHIISWQSHGRCFVVRNQKEFAEKVLPLYFRQSKFSSFQRQLNLYGFKRLTQGPDKNAYYHELFLRSMPDLAARITRTIVKNKGPRKAASPRTEPNLYSYPPLPPCSAKKEEKKDVKAVLPVPVTSGVVSAPIQAPATVSTSSGQAVRVMQTASPTSSPDLAAAASLRLLSSVVAHQMVQNISQPPLVRSITPPYSPLSLVCSTPLINRGVFSSLNAEDFRRSLHTSMLSLDGRPAAW